MNYEPTSHSHLPLAIVAVAATKGTILELGLGWGSTPVMATMARVMNRQHLAFEDAPDWIAAMQGIVRDPIRLVAVNKWKELEFQRCGMALVDHSCANQRPDSVRSLFGVADIVVAHDTGPSAEHEAVYQWGDCFSQFKFVVIDHRWEPWTTAVTNDRALWSIMKNAIGEKA